MEPLETADIRVLGSLIEKEITTPDNYPLTLNALVTACNQTTNRDPVLTLDEATVSASIDRLARIPLVRGLHRGDARVKRYRHVLNETLNLHPAELAVMCVLMLRGPQTTGEIRTRTNRLFDFIDLRHVEITLDALATLSTPLVMQLPRRPGQKEVRYAHLLAGEPIVDETEPAPSRSAGTADRVEVLEQAVDSLRAEIAELREQLEAFRREFQ